MVDSRGVEPPLRGEEERWARLEPGRCGGGEAAAPRGDGGRCAVGSSRVKLTAVGLVPPGAEAGLSPHMRRGVSSVLAPGRRPLASATGASYFFAICVSVSRSACCLSKRSDCSTRSGCDLASRGLGEGARGRGEAARLVVRDIPRVPKRQFWRPLRSLTSMGDNERKYQRGSHTANYRRHL